MARVDFTDTVKRLAAERVGYLCSRPNCPNPYTIGPLGGEKRTSLGDAAHIRAASDGGPRAVDGLARDDLRSVANAIWLCARCHRLVDGDDARYTINELERWKVDAEERARERLEGYRGEPGVRVPDLLPPTTGFWRVALVSQLAVRYLGIAPPEQALRFALRRTLRIVQKDASHRLPILLDEDGLLVTHATETGEGFRVRATPMGVLEVSLAFRLGGALSVGKGNLPFDAEHSIDVHQLMLGVSFVTRFYCEYGLGLGSQPTLGGIRQIVLLDLEDAGMFAPSELLGGSGGSVGVATVDQIYTPVGPWQCDWPVGGLPSLDQTKRAVVELGAFFRNRWEGMLLNPNAVEQHCASWHNDQGDPPSVRIVAVFPRQPRTPHLATKWGRKPKRNERVHSDDKGADGGATDGAARSVGGDASEGNGDLTGDAVALEAGIREDPGDAEQASSTVGNTPRIESGQDASATPHRCGQVGLGRQSRRP